MQYNTSMCMSGNTTTPLDIQVGTSSNDTFQYLKCSVIFILLAQCTSVVFMVKFTSVATGSQTLACIPRR
jgi:hypothetical protein